MNSTLTALVFACLTLTAAPAFSSSPADGNNAQMIWDACRQTHSIHKLQRQFDEAVNVAVNSSQSMTTTAKERVSENLKALLSIESLLLAYQREFAEIDAQGAHEIQRWCLSPIGKRIIKSEEKESPDEDAAAIMNRALASIRNTKNPENRRNSIVELVNSSHLSELAPETIGMTAAIHLAAQELEKPEDLRLSRADFIRALVDLGREMQRDLTPLFEAGIVDSYADVSDEDLAAYVLFLKSAAGKAWAGASYSAMHRYFKSAVRGMVDAVAPR
ncbi:MAG: hypothetical protein ACYCY9_10010 [Thiobacillus sp.]